MSVLSEITLKLKTATPEQLNAILEILNKKPEKKRKTNAWIEYLNTYKAEHPELPHKQTTKDGEELYE